jgi:tetratricopeptide (TPR) repeat protein
MSINTSRQDRIRQAKDQAAVADNLSNLGTLSLHNGDTAAALTYYRQALEIDRGLETPRAIGLDLFNIASTYQAREDFPQALEYYERALPPFRLTSDLPHIAEALFRMGLISERIGQPEKAKQYFQAAVEVASRAGMPELEKKARLKID